MISLFKNLSNKIWKNIWWQQLFFIVSAIFTICFLGYYFGTFDQASHIPFLKKFVDPSLFPKDKFLDLRHVHFSYFWLFFIPFYKSGALEITMFIIHLLFTYFTYWSIYRLTKTIFNSPLASFLSVLAFVLPHLSFGGFTLFEFSLLNRTFVLPFLLLAYDFYLNKKYLPAFILLGLMFNLHALSVNFVLAMFIFDQLLRLKQIGFKKSVLNLAVFLLAASPVLIWKSQSSGVDLSIHRQWYLAVKNGILNNVFSLTAINPPIIFLSLGGVTSVIIFFLLKKYLTGEKITIINNFVFAGIIIILIQILTSNFIPITIIIQSQIIRVGIFLLFFSYIFFCRFIAQLVEKQAVSNSLFLLLLASLIFSTSPLLLLFGLLIVFFRPTDKWINLITGLTLIGFIITLIITARLNIWRPGLYVYPKQLTGYAVQLWAKNNTSKDSVFIVPPHLWWFYNLDWRVISERSTITTLSELLEIAFEPKYFDYWQQRFEDVAPNALSKFKGDAFENFKITAQAYYSLSEENIRSVADKYQASYFVVEQPYRYQFPIVYEDHQFRVYLIR